MKDFFLCLSIQTNNLISFLCFPYLYHSFMSKNRASKSSSIMLLAASFDRQQLRSSQQSLNTTNKTDSVDVSVWMECYPHDESRVQRLPYLHEFTISAIT
ncbi:unnamed protein product [Albugo candida]|uniref:Uncharacterized protein n=1 Tax=Albugo candida TaxID=65357 RepID=A0A024FXU8_9STRA|nr:unnamed protein product [Albugo candida]|eukprot:CCI11752.1 unnamed protein product [Albugo candida]